MAIKQAAQISPTLQQPNVRISLFSFLSRQLVCLASFSILLCLVALHEAVAQEQDSHEPDIFEQVFGKERQQLQEVIMPFSVDGLPHGEIQVWLSPEEVKIEAAALIRELEGKLQPEKLSELQEKADDEGRISMQALEGTGLEGTYDPAKLELAFKTAPSARPASLIELSGHRPPSDAGALSPSAFSTYVNLRTGLDHVQQSAIGFGEGFQPFRADLEGAVNLHDWVFEGTGGYAEDAPSLWRRGGLRLVRDDPERMIRYSLGDLAYPTAGFQVFQPMLGFTMARNFSLQPYRVTEPRGRTSFFLRAPSRVEVFVNGQQVQTLHLEAGPHHIEDFLLASGGNNVSLRITDDVGRVETIQLSYFFDARLLARGEHEFSYSFGIPSRPGDRGPEYNHELPVLSLFHRLGLTDSLTAGLNVQGNEKQQIAGADAVWATPLGTFQPDIALSAVEGAGIGYASRLGYRYYDASSYWGSTLALSVQYASPGFASLGNLLPANVSAWNFSARYSQRLMWNMHGGIGGTYEVRRRTPTGLSGLNLFLGKRFGRKVFADLTLDRRERILGKTEYRALISLTVRLGGGRQSIRASHDTFLDTTRADWYFASAQQAGGLDGNLGLQRNPDDYGLFGAGRYTGYRAEASVSQDVTTPGRQDEEIDSRTRFRFGTALVYADGQWAASRPVRDSFAIVTPHPELKGQKIGVDPVREAYAAKVDRWGPAVVPDLHSYLIRNVTIDAPELPPGYELGPGVYTLRPTYRSGTVIQAGTGSTVLVDGILEADDGTPVSLQAGEITSVLEQGRAPIKFFTNRRGRFNVEGLNPGPYEMRLFGDPPRKLRFEIPEGEAGIYDIGTLRLQPLSPDETPGGSRDR